ncbi:MAG: hypothetical protein DRP09_10410 [Candidatus Thorarchaeota archaeon]|nr:MAG: hypothetical protein DRP09_10410 [Candidatus Thorarchaeota archaeon]
MSGSEHIKDEQQGTIVVNLHKDEYDVYIGRAGRGKVGYFGNPFDVRVFGREESLRRYEEYFLRRIEEEPVFREKILELRGKRLGCFCKPRKCHGDIIVAWLEQHEEELIATARKNGRAQREQPDEKSIKRAKQFHLRMLARKLTPEPVRTEMRTVQERDHELYVERQRTLLTGGD